MNHVQTWVKVNAPIDTGIAELVELLNEFPAVQTIESCQGTESEAAWVAFWCGEHWRRPWEDLCEFVFGYLGPKMTATLGNAISLQVIITENGGIQGELTVQPGAMRPTVQALKLLLTNYQARGLP
ncbi:MAG: hypothetical protein AB1473_16075 [Thermodesulfobacteriota bacterium]